MIQIILDSTVMFLSLWLLFWF